MDGKLKAGTKSSGIGRRGWLGWLATALPAVGLGACGGNADLEGDPAAPHDAGAGGDAPPGADVFEPEDAGADVESPGDALESGPSCEPTGSDALGPFHRPGAPFRTEIAGPEEPGQRIRIVGTVLADDCVTPVAGAVLDIWHADASGVYHSAEQNYRLRGQVKTDADGRFSFDSILPGHYDDRPRHVHLIVSSPGFLPLTTQLYFAGDPLLGPNDSCQPPTCHSSDPDRITALEPVATDAGELWVGTFEVRLAA